MCQKPQALNPSLVKIVSGQWKIASNGKKNSKMLFRLVCRNILAQTVEMLQYLLCSIIMIKRM
jgi:hypothetical protein